MTLLAEHGTGSLSREKQAFVMWLIAAIGVAGFGLLALLLGRERAENVLASLISKIFGDPGVKQ